eukprot:gene18159-16361_t
MPKASDKTPLLNAANFILNDEDGSAFVNTGGDADSASQVVLAETTGSEGWDETTAFSPPRAGNGKKTLGGGGGGGTFISSSSSEADGAMQPGGNNKAASGKLTFWQAYLNLVRASVGPGCLSLPYAFSNAGPWLAPSLLVLLTVIVYINMRILVYLRHELQARVGSSTVVRTLGDIGNAVG